MPTESDSELRRFADLDPSLFSGSNCVHFDARVDTPLKKPRKIAGRGMRGGGLEPEAEAEKLRLFAGRCCTVWRRSAPFGPQGAKLASSKVADRSSGRLRLASSRCD